MTARTWKAWIVCDPYAGCGSALLKSFDTEDEADSWLAAQERRDPDGYGGCVILPKDDALQEYR